MKFIRLILVFLFICTAAFAESETITVISDAHINIDKQNNSITPSIKNLAQAIEQTNKDSSNVVVFLGDNIQSADKANLVMFSKLINRLNKPYYTVIGNRDIAKSRDLVKKDYYKILNKFSSNKISALPSYKKHNGFVFIFMSGANETFPTFKGYYKNQELAFLDETLTKFHNKKAIIFQHFPVVPPKLDERRTTVKPEHYLEILNKHDNVLAVVSGHYHRENVIEKNGVKHISIAALGQAGEYEQIKIYKNKDGSYSLTTKILTVE